MTEARRNPVCGPSCAPCSSRNLRIAALAVTLVGLLLALLLCTVVKQVEPVGGLIGFASLAMLVLSAGEVMRHWRLFGSLSPTERKLTAVLHQDRTARRGMASRHLWLIIPGASVALAGYALLSPGAPFLSSDLPHSTVDVVRGLAAALFLLGSTISMPIVAGVAAVLVVGREDRSGPVQEVLATPLGPRALVVAAMRLAIRRSFFWLLAVAPLYMLAINWHAWLSALGVGPLRAEMGFSPTGMFFWLLEHSWMPELWARTISSRRFLATHCFFGAMLLLSDFLLSVCSASVGILIGSRFKRSVLALATAGFAGFCVWVLRLTVSLACFHLICRDHSTLFSLEDVLCVPSAVGVATPALAALAMVVAFTFLAVPCLMRLTSRWAMTGSTSSDAGRNEWRRRDLAASIASWCLAATLGWLVWAGSIVGPRAGYGLATLIAILLAMGLGRHLCLLCWLDRPRACEGDK